MFPWITSSIIKNCGTGAGGFQAGNTCATGGAVDVKRIDLEKFEPRESWEEFSPAAALTNYLEILRRTDRKMGDDPSDNSDQFNKNNEQNPFYPKSQSDPKEVQNLANLLAFYTNSAYRPMARAVLWSEKDGMGFIPSQNTSWTNPSDNEWLQFLTDNHGLVGFNSDKNDSSELFRDNFEKSYRQACVSAHDQLSGALQQTELDSGKAVIYRGSTIRGIQSPDYPDGDSENNERESKINSLVKAFETKGIDMKSNTSWSKSSVIASGFSTSGNSGSLGLPVVFAVQGFKAGLDVYQAEKYIKPNVKSEPMGKLEQEVVIPPTKIRVVGVDKLYIKGVLSALVVRGEAVAKPIKAPKKPKKDFDFIQSVLKNCGTGAGGFQAGNTCGSGTAEPDYKELELKLGVPATLLREGIIDVDGFISAKLNYGEIIPIENDKDLERNSYFFEGSSDVQYAYKVSGSNNTEFSLNVDITATKRDDRTVADISFTVNGSMKEKVGGALDINDQNIVGQGSKIFALVEKTISHFMKTKPEVRNFQFLGGGSDRNGKARQLLYRRFASKIAKKFNGTVIEDSESRIMNDKTVHTSTKFIIKGDTKSKALNENNIIATFTYTFVPALVNPIKDKAEQEFWGLKNDQGSKSVTNRNCGTGAGGFQAGNTCGSGTGQIEIQYETTPKDVDDLLEDSVNRNFIYGCPEVAPCDQATNLPNAKIKERLLFEIYSGNGYKDILNGDDEDHGIDERTIDEFVQGGYMSFEDEKSYGIDIQQYDLWQEETRSAIPEIRRMLNESAQNTEMNMPKEQSVFRGISVGSGEIESFINGLKDGILETEKPQSWSKSIRVAHKFASDTNPNLRFQIPVVLRASGINRGVDMNQSNLANRRSELEMVLPSAQYKIKNVRVFKGDDDRVKLVEVDVET